MIPKHSFLCLLIGFALLTSCGNDSVSEIDTPETYTFLRNGNSTVSFSGQTTRILMAEELLNALGNEDTNETDLLNMFRNKDENGNDVDPFQSAKLNESTKSIKSKVAASKDFFFTNTTETFIITNQIEAWIKNQTLEVFSNKDVLAEPGVAGQIADGSSVRYVSGKGLEYNQVIGKCLIGALMVDQIVNNYLSIDVLDEGSNRTNNDAILLEDETNYTTMEHKWDEAYGYLFGNANSPEDPLENLGSEDNFLNEYVGRVNDDPDFAGIGREIFNAYKLGRAAIIAKDYKVRDSQADIIKELLSEVIAVRAVYYLQNGKNALPTDANLSSYGPAFHDLSEAIGFIYSLRFTRKSGSNESYFTRSEVDEFFDMLLNNNVNGLWDLDHQTLDNISNKIADKFNFTVAEAAQ